MKDFNLKGDNATLFQLALIISKRTATIATIKYGEVIISNGDIEIALMFNDNAEKMSLIFENIDRPYWVLHIPTKSIVDMKELKALINIVLGVINIRSVVKPFISIPTNYFELLFEEKEIRLDSFFNITTSRKYAKYRINKIGECFYFFFVGSFTPIQLSCVYLVPRPGKGNEDL